MRRVILSKIALERHLDQKNDEGCGYIKVPCTIRCGRRFYRKDLQNHLENECRLREYTCQHDGCDCKDTYERVTGEHKRKCPHHPFDCPNRCGRRQIKRKDIPAHQETCPKQPVDCPYRPAGCNVPLVREDVQRHLERSRDTHSLQLMGAITTLTSSVQTEINMFMPRNEATHASLSCLETHLKLGKRTLQKKGDSISERMTCVYEYKRSGKVWYSNPFYYMDGYKMQLAVHGNQRALSVSLLLLKGEYDDRLKWPIAADIISTEQLEKAASQQDESHRQEQQEFRYTMFQDLNTVLATLLELHVDPKVQPKESRKQAVSAALDRSDLPQTMTNELYRNPNVLSIIVDIVSPTSSQKTGFACWPFGVTRVTGDSNSKPLRTLEYRRTDSYNYLQSDSLVFCVSVD